VFRVIRLSLAVILTGIATFAGAGSDYLRIQRQPDQSDCLQVAIREFSLGPPHEVTLSLVGVSHLGSAAYYATLQERLDAADVVLFEGVDGDTALFREGFRADPPPENLQSHLARALGLVFQLHHIDYTRGHFVNSDLTSEQMMALFSGEEMPEVDHAARARMEQVMDNMEQVGWHGGVSKTLLDLLESHPGWSRGLRWGLVTILGNATGNMSEYAGLPQSLRRMMEVLIERRNEKVLDDIALQLETMEPGQTLAIFYGAAHMPHFETEILSRWQAEPGESEWLTAFCGNLYTSGLGVIERNLLTLMIRQQVRTLNLMSRP